MAVVGKTEYVVVGKVVDITKFEVCCQIGRGVGGEKLRFRPLPSPCRLLDNSESNYMSI